jgi:ABC-type Zn uptake system ZnuABC Zn-binding protein ZnuA
MRGIAVIALLVAGSCSCMAQERISVVTTTNTLRSLVEAVGRGRVDVTSLVPPGIDAEEYQPKPQDILKLKNARMLVRVGLDYDLWVDRLVAQAKNEQISRAGFGYVDASVNITVLELRGISVGPNAGHSHGSGNPHYWLDPKSAEIITGNIADALAKMDQAHAEAYAEDRAEFLNRLTRKLSEWDAKLVPVRNIPLVAYHNSWPYFARRFRLSFIGFLETKPGISPSPSHLADIIHEMRVAHAGFLVREPQEPERDLSFVAKQTGAAIVTLATSVGDLPGTEDYISMFDTDIESLLTALKH